MGPRPHLKDVTAEPKASIGDRGVARQERAAIQFAGKWHTFAYIYGETKSRHPARHDRWRPPRDSDEPLWWRLWREFCPGSNERCFLKAMSRIVVDSQVSRELAMLAGRKGDLDRAGAIGGYSTPCPTSPPHDHYLIRVGTQVRKRDGSYLKISIASVRQ
jgi:hypothetical protein